MAYSRGQPNIIGAVDARDGYDHGSSRTQSEMHTELSRHTVNIPVIAATGPRYSSATYPAFRGGSGCGFIPVERDGTGRQQTNSIVVQQSEPASAKNYRSSVSTQLSTTQLPLYTGSKNDAVASQNSTSSYVGATSSLPNRKRVDGSAEFYPTPVSSQIVYTSRVMPEGSSGMAGKVAVASSRRAVYQPGVVSDASPVNQPQLRQIPVVVVSSQTQRQDSSGDHQDQRVFRQSQSYHEAHPQSQSLTNKSMVSPVSRSRSVDPSCLKEAEVDALTDLLVQNMNVAGNPDFCGVYFRIIFAYLKKWSF